MGFRDMEAFNQALLAKQAWRLLQVPSSLCGRVRKARYYDHGTILNATCLSGASYTFRSILHSRDCYLLSTALDFPKEERMMQQSSISISLSF